MTVHICVCVWNRTYLVCLYTPLFSIGLTNWDRITVWKIFCLREKDIRKHSFSLIFYLYWTLSRLVTSRAKFRIRRLYLLGDVALDPRPWCYKQDLGALTFLSAHPTLICVIEMIKGGKNRMKMQCKYCESQLTFLLKLLLTMYAFCGWILTLFLAVLGSVGLC